jgi:Putative DNA-binding domain
LIVDRRTKAMGHIQQSVMRFDPGVLAPFAVGDPTSRRSGGNLAVHYDDVAPMDVLAARYPVVRRLVGDESFRAMALRFIAREPSRSAALEDHGDAFPCFLRSRGKAASIEYVADIAELEMVRGKARHAADARPAGAQAFSSLSIKQLKGTRVELHPSVFLVASRFPIVTIWENNQFDGQHGMIERWRAESALVTRPFVEVEVRRLPPGGHAFVGALSAGETMVAAADAGKGATPEFDVASNLMMLIEADIIVGFCENA